MSLYPMDGYQKRVQTIAQNEWRRTEPPDWYEDDEYQEEDLDDLLVRDGTIWI